MPKRLKQVLAALFCLTGCVPSGPTKPPGDILRWAPYYGTSLPAESFADLDLVIFDRRFHPAFTGIQDSTLVLAYVTMGEVYDDVPEKKTLAKNKALLFKNKNWNSHAVDLTSKTWRKLVLGYVDNAVDQGFDGVMLDTVDSPLEWARSTKPERLAAMQKAAVSLIGEIRATHPNIKIMLNRGFDILPDAAPYLDYALAESILTEKDISSGQYRRVPPKRYADAVEQLHTVVARAEHLHLFTLDYWDLDDVNGLESIYAEQRRAGFIPYVTTPDLKAYTPEPEPYPPTVTDDD